MNINGTWSEQEGYLTHILRDYALDFLRRAAQQDKPFVLLFSPNAPHFAYAPGIGQPQGPLDLEFFLRPPEPAPGDERLHANLRPHRPPSFNRKDSAKLSALAAQGKLDETVVVYLADNGHFWGEHGIAWGKNAVYEEASRVPFAVRYPRLTSRPRVETRLVANIDIAPTFYELAGLPIPPEVDGRSLVPLLDSARAQAAPAAGWRDELLIEGWVGEAALKLGWAPYAAIHTGRYVYVETEGDRSELYDLATDPHQQHNQAENQAHASVMVDLKARLKRLRPAFAEK
jgi:hypothetical protein